MQRPVPGSAGLFGLEGRCFCMRDSAPHPASRSGTSAPPPAPSSIRLRGHVPNACPSAPPALPRAPVPAFPLLHHVLGISRLLLSRLPHPRHRPVFPRPSPAPLHAARFLRRAFPFPPASTHADCLLPRRFRIVGSRRRFPTMRRFRASRVAPPRRSPPRGVSPARCSPPPDPRPAFRSPYRSVFPPPSLLSFSVICKCRINA